ncbi:MAG: hypothetical protein Q8876_06055 [Bacillota bacterium]|nr:hypothetical protein [Bacillota bacterium]
MCLVITAFAAVITTLIWYFKAHNENIKFSMLVLMYWGATLMWVVDGFFSIAKGEPFLDLSINDTLLGFVIVLCGLAVWLFVLLYKDPKNVFDFLKGAHKQTPTDINKNK